MEKVRFGKTQMQVTPMTLGTWGIGGAGWDTNSDETTLDAMQPMADRRGVTLAQIAINWSRQKPFIDTSILGAQTRARVESNVSCLDWELTQEELQELDQAIEEAMG